MFPILAYKIAILISIIIILIAISDYIKTLKSLQSRAYKQSTEAKVVYTLLLIIMGFSVVSYIAFSSLVESSGYTTKENIIVLTFLISSIFILCAILTIGTATKTVTEGHTELILSLIQSLEAKDQYTKGHSLHVSKVIEILYNSLPPDEKKKINKAKLIDAATLHDIGKIYMPDEILKSPSSLTDEEWDIMKTHPSSGKALLDKTCYKEISNWVLYHHERVDGTGYYSLPGELIPMESKLITICDIFSALYTERVYRKKLEYSEAITIIKAASGTVLDPELVKIFITIPKNVLDECFKESES